MKGRKLGVSRSLNAAEESSASSLLTCSILRTFSQIACCKEVNKVRYIALPGSKSSSSELTDRIIRHIRTPVIMQLPKDSRSWISMSS